MKIKKGTKKDIRTIAKLMQEYQKYENGLDKKIELQKLEEIIKEESAHMKSGCIYLLLKEGKEMSGIANISIGHLGKDKFGVIHNFFIKKKFRGQKYGTNFADYIFRFFKKEGCKRAKTFVFTKNKKAKRFWEKQGVELDAGFGGAKTLR
jgi:GNAT superfamily N-acetyltransferase